MEFRVLGEVFAKGANQAYKGVDRSEPDYVGDLGPTAAINQLWHWYGQRTYERLSLSEEDLDRAVDLIAAYRDLGITYELVELAPGASSLGKGCFLGYDVVDGPAYHSALVCGLKCPPGALDRPGGILGPVMRLVHCYFRPKLNDHGLFPDQETAAFLLQVLQSLDEVAPDFYESLLNEWKVIAIGVVRKLPSDRGVATSFPLSE